MVFENILGASRKKPNHIAITLDGEAADMSHAISTKQTLEQVYDKRNLLVQQLIKAQTKQNVPAVTILLLSGREKDSEQSAAIIDSIAKLFSQLKSNSDIAKHQVKAAVLGKWYDLPGRAVDEIKNVLNATKDNEKFYFNICLKYDGQEEIADACRLLTRKATAERISPENITKEMIKENLYSQLPPPDKIIINNEPKTNGFMLWDSTCAEITFTKKPWQEFTLQDFLKEIR